MNCETTNEYMEEDMGECPKCDCAVKRKDLAWRIGYYLDICAKCDDDEGSTTNEDDEDECNHKYECGCNKEYCENCEEDEDEDESELKERRLDCENQMCKSYYAFRNDNCTCDGLECGFCNPVGRT